MEAAAVLGFASSILQFIDFASHVLEIGSQIRRPGLSQCQLSLEQVSKQVREHANRIKPPDGAQKPFTESDQALGDLADGCEAIAKRILKFIRKFRSTDRDQESRSKIKTLAQAVKLEWQRKDIDDLCKQLDRYRAAIDSHIAFETRDTVKQSIVLLHDLSNQSGSNHESTQATVDRLHENVDTLADQVSLMNQMSQHHQKELLDVINVFIDQLRSKELFASMPPGLIGKYPSLRTNAVKKHAEIENAVLHTLKFRMMSVRETEIHDAHSQTFRWIYDAPKADDERWDNLADWLRTGAGCYWIGGKAGSGKSTLLKFMTLWPKTQQLLEEWAGSHTLVVASYFFWNAGTELQKNQAGLLRSILSSILSRRRDLIPVAFPFLYDDLIARKFPGGVDESEMPKKDVEKDSAAPMVHEEQSKEEDFPQDLHLGELRKAFSEICAQGHKHIRICLFIDGLDEFTGDQAALVELLTSSTSQSDMLKAVVSSRPEPVFVDGFLGMPQLHLQDMTRDDMTRYVNDMLTSNRRFLKLQGKDPAAAERLIQTVLSRASGVFLWIKLVVKSLLRGLSDGNYLRELEKIVEKYPPELHDLYIHMFERMKPEYRVGASKLFQYVFRSKEVEREPLSALRLEFTNEYSPTDSLSMPHVLMSFPEADDMISSIEDRLRSRCCGLLEVRRTPDALITVTPDEGRITLLHRSVLDFWKDPVTRKQIEVETENFHFEPSEGLLASILFQAKKLFVVKPSDEEGRTKLINIIRDFLAHCQIAERGIGARQYEYLREFDSVLSTLWRIKTWHSLEKAGWGHFVSRRLSLLLGDQRDTEPVLTLAVHSRLLPYVEGWICSCTLSERNIVFSSILIRLITWSMCSTSRLHMLKYAEIMNLLLRSGYDTAVADNEHVQLSKSPWKRLLYIDPFDLQPESLPVREALQSEHSATDATDSDRFMVWADTLEAFLDLGAELDRPYRELPAMQSARGLIESRLRLPPGLKKKMSDDEVKLLDDRIIELRKVLDEIPKDISNHLDVKARRLKISAGNRRREQRRKASQDHRAQGSAIPEQTSDLSSNSDRFLKTPPGKTQDGSCSRCKTIEALQEVGFSPSEAWLGLEKANAGNDSVAVATWILDNRCSLSPATEQVRKENTSRISFEESTSTVQKVRQSRPKLTGSKQWTKVVRSQPPASICTVVGAETVPIKTAKPRRKYHKGPTASQGGGSSSEMGVIDLGTGGRFTWILESDNISHSDRAEAQLSGAQEEGLKAFVSSMLRN